MQSYRMVKIKPLEFSVKYSKKEMRRGKEKKLILVIMTLDCIAKIKIRRTPQHP